jgi:phosphoribosylanthranilate isomerase
MVYVKICGIRRLEDVFAAAEYGADAVGVLVGQGHRSPDFLHATQAATIVAAVPRAVTSVVVTHLVDPEDIGALTMAIGATTIQLHGDTAPAQAALIKQRLPHIKTYKEIHVINDQSLDTAT